MISIAWGSNWAVRLKNHDTLDLRKPRHDNFATAIKRVLERVDQLPVLGLSLPDPPAKISPPKTPGYKRGGPGRLYFLKRIQNQSFRGLRLNPWDLFNSYENAQDTHKNMLARARTHHARANI